MGGKRGGYGEKNMWEKNEKLWGKKCIIGTALLVAKLRWRLKGPNAAAPADATLSMADARSPCGGGTAGLGLGQGGPSGAVESTLLGRAAGRSSVAAVLPTGSGRTQARLGGARGRDVLSEASYPSTGGL